MIPIANPLMSEEEKQGVLEVLDSGMLAQGPKVAAFERAFADYCGAGYAVATSSGTTALHTALLAHGIGEGDEVITSPFTFISSANTILFTGARPIFVDIDPVTFNVDPAQIEQAVTARTRAIMPVHLFGLTADMAPIMSIAEEHDLVVIEDACQAHGAEYRGRRAGSFGTGCFSFYPTKNMTTAEGGMITTDDEEVVERSRAIRQHGMERRYYHDELGYNYRMTDVHAAIGLAQLGKLERFNEARIANAQYLSHHLEGVVKPTVPEGYRHVFHQYTVRLPVRQRDALAKHLEANDIGYGIYYPVPVHRQTFYREDLGYDLRLPQAERAAEGVISLPVHPALSQEDLESIVRVVNDFARGAD
jgi:dTDP-4-amino-4,6-dideoxygalactose transaminase